VQVLEASDQLRFSFETPDEIRLVGEVRQDDFDRYFAANAGLLRPVNCAETPGAYPLQKGVTFDDVPTQVAHATPLLLLCYRSSESLKGEWKNPIT
jgi:hypothetical protein